MNYSDITWNAPRLDITLDLAKRYLYGQGMACKNRLSGLFLVAFLVVAPLYAEQLPAEKHDENLFGERLTERTTEEEIEKINFLVTKWREYRENIPAFKATGAAKMMVSEESRSRGRRDESYRVQWMRDGDSMHIKLSPLGREDQWRRTKHVIITPTEITTFANGGTIGQKSTLNESGRFEGEGASGYLLYGGSDPLACFLTPGVHRRPSAMPNAHVFYAVANYTDQNVSIDYELQPNGTIILWSVSPNIRKLSKLVIDTNNSYVPLEMASTRLGQSTVDPILTVEWMDALGTVLPQKVSQVDADGNRWTIDVDNYMPLPAGVIFDESLNEGNLIRVIHRQGNLKTVHTRNNGRWALEESKQRVTADSGRSRYTAVAPSGSLGIPIEVSKTVDIKMPNTANTEVLPDSLLGDSGSVSGTSKAILVGMVTTASVISLFVLFLWLSRSNSGKSL